MKNKCPYKVIATRHSKQNIWPNEIKCGDHNHLPTFAGAYTTYQKAAMTDDIKLKIVTQTQVDASARQNLLSIYLGTDKKNHLYKAKDIYNQCYYYQYKKLGLFSLVQALIFKLNEKKRWYMEYCSNANFCITRLFFAKTSLHKILELNYEVLLINCIYKTNVY